MKVRTVVAFLAGSVAVYAMVACSSEIAQQLSAPDGAVDLDAVVDALIGGPRDALADETGTDAADATDGAAETAPPSCVTCPSTPPAPPSDEYVSSPRLRARYSTQTVTDGARAKTFVGWFDVAMATNCAAGVAEDGATRCLPVGVPDVGTLVYTDPACTVPYAVERADVTSSCGAVSASPLLTTRVYPQDPSCTAPRALLGQRVFRVAAPTMVGFPTGTPLFYGGAGALGCNRADVPPFCTAGVACPVRLVTAIAPSEFVAITLGETHD